MHYALVGLISVCAYLLGALAGTVAERRRTRDARDQRFPVLYERGSGELITFVHLGAKHGGRSAFWN